jgi:hypothetical protein
MQCDHWFRRFLNDFILSAFLGMPYCHLFVADRKQATSSQHLMSPRIDLLFLQMLKMVLLYSVFFRNVISASCTNLLDLLSLQMQHGC